MKNGVWFDEPVRWIGSTTTAVSTSTIDAAVETCEAKIESSVVLPVSWKVFEKADVAIAEVLE
jgi:hypothetical protein